MNEKNLSMGISYLDWMSLDPFENRDNLTDSTVWNTGETGDIYSITTGKDTGIK